MILPRQVDLVISMMTCKYTVMFTMIGNYTVTVMSTMAVKHM